MGAREDGVNGRILRCKFHSALFPSTPPDLPSQPFPPISVLLFPTSSFLYLRPPVPLFLKSSRGSPLSCRRAPRQNYRDRLARADMLFRGSSRFSRGKSSASQRSRMVQRPCRGCAARSRGELTALKETWGWRSVSGIN